MLETLKPGDIVEMTLRDKSTVTDTVVSKDRDSTTMFKNLGYRYVSGMEFHDHPSKGDIVKIFVKSSDNGYIFRPEKKDKQVIYPSDNSFSVVEKENEVFRSENERLKAQIADHELLIGRHSRALHECLAQLSRCLECGEYEAFQLEIDAILNGSKDSVPIETPKEDPESKPAVEIPKRGRKPKGKENADKTPEPASDSQETGTAEGE